MDRNVYNDDDKKKLAGQKKTSCVCGCRHRKQPQ